MILFTTNDARTVGTLTARLAGESRTRLLDPEYETQLLWENIPLYPDFLILCASIVPQSTAPGTLGMGKVRSRLCFRDAENNYFEFRSELHQML